MEGNTLHIKEKRKDDPSKKKSGKKAKNGAREMRHEYLLTLLQLPPYRGWQRSEGLLLVHNFLSLDIFCSVLDT